MRKVERKVERTVEQLSNLRGKASYFGVVFFSFLKKNIPQKTCVYRSTF